MKTNYKYSLRGKYMPPIHIMIKPVSGECNMQCKYCFYTDEMAHRHTALRGRMTEDTARNLIRRAFIHAHESVSFTFQGGEPTLAGVEFYRFFVKTVKEYNSRGLRVSYALQTNATLIDEQLCGFFAENGFLIGVSLDGTQNIHDSLRTDKNENGTYDKVRRSIKMLKKYNVEFSLLCVLTRSAAEHIREVLPSLSRYGSVQLIPCIDSFDKTISPFSLDAKSYGKALVEIFDIYRQALLSSSPISERRMDNYMSILLGYHPEMCGMSGRCGLYFLAEADGSVYPCDFYAIDDYKLGNINETSFSRMENSDTMGRFQEEGALPPAECRKCKYNYICRGGCRRDREPSLERNKYCESYKYFFDMRLEDMRALVKLIKQTQTL